MPVTVDLTGCCTECFMPLHGGICEFDPEHTPIPQDLNDPELADWFPSWLHNYQARTSWDFAILGPLPPVVEEDAPALKHVTARAVSVRDIPKSVQRHPGFAIWGRKPLCPECLMPLENGSCPLNLEHDTNKPEYRDEFDVPRGTGAQLVDFPLVARAAPPTSLPLDCKSEAARVDGTLVTASATAGKASNIEPIPAPCNAQLPGNIAAWLFELDALGFLYDYHDAIAGHFDSPAQVLDVYARRGDEGQAIVLAEKFLDEMGVRKLGHRRLFQKWFKQWTGPGDVW